MAIVLERYAIKEVADVMFYELDSKGAPSAPVLYLDTLKTSTLSQSSEKVDARGGKGNVKLLSWDTNKELTIEMEDAVFSAKSLGIMFGGKMSAKGSKQEVLKTLRYDTTQIKEATVSGSSAKDYLTFTINGNELYIAKNLVTVYSYQDSAGNELYEPIPVDRTTVDWAGGKVTGTDPAQAIDFITFDLLDCTNGTIVNGVHYATARTADNGSVFKGVTIDIGAEFDSNTYYITGDTYARNVANGKDEFLQFIIPKGKVSAEDVSLTMEADGDPATFSMTIDCLKSESGSMVKLIKYSLSAGGAATDGKNKGAASVLDDFEATGTHDEYVSGMNIAPNTSQLIDE